MKLDTACSEGMQGRSAEQAPPLQAGARPQAFRNIGHTNNHTATPNNDDDDNNVIIIVTIMIIIITTTSSP